MNQVSQAITQGINWAMPEGNIFMAKEQTPAPSKPGDIKTPPTTQGTPPKGAKLNVGKVTGGKRALVVAGGEWNDTPYFGPGLVEDSDHMLAFPVGMSLEGTLKTMRVTKAEKERDRKTYGCFEDAEGNKFRIAAPGQLKYILESEGIGSTLEITYEGKKYVESLDEECHQFKVQRVESKLNS